MRGGINLQPYVNNAVNWRKAKLINTRKTYIIISIFFLIYFILGLLLDLSIYSFEFPNASARHILVAMADFTIIPYATIITLLIASLSLAVTFLLYDKIMLLGTEYHEVKSTGATSPSENLLYNVVEEMKIAAGLDYMPRIFVINADYMNAFASGYSEQSAMIAITSALLTKLNRSELQAVVAHELSHIRHMDIKLTLTASVLTNLILIVLDLCFYNMISRRNNNGKSLEAIVVILRYLLPIINLLLILYLSRTREYMADAGAVELTRDNQALISALLKIQNEHKNNTATVESAYQKQGHENVRQAAYIYDPAQAGITSGMSTISDIFSTHPSMPKRLAALGFKINKPR